VRYDRESRGTGGAGVERSLKLVATWPAWDGQTLTSDDGRTFTPHKAVRRIADHLVEVEWYAQQVGDLSQP